MSLADNIALHKPSNHHGEQGCSTPDGCDSEAEVVVVRREAVYHKSARYWAGLGVLAAGGAAVPRGAKAPFLSPWNGGIFASSSCLARLSERMALPFANAIRGRGSRDGNSYPDSRRVRTRWSSGDIVRIYIRRNSIERVVPSWKWLRER